ncbi:hypothetical protein [Oscillatoria salina]|uniref:hypothetical protein n=1 Tax=Oscillatoria salina TaxID=331517 RepID=UPI0013BB6BE9|nr:hypothetical protein [Oscillatoria salina]MBZ8179466.1 hypothetical protein [Oscillatoria salina IIICB1]NET89093.1 hypothetical protein [Kamptonema sp. SIO1D9]
MTKVRVPRDRCGFEVVSAVGGRMRLRATDKNAQGKLEVVAQKLRQKNGVREIRPNQQTGSLVVKFEPNIIKQTQILAVLGESGIGEIKALSEAEKRATRQANAVAEAATRLQSFVPSIGGILLTRSLGFYGWTALPVYLISTSLIREVWEQLDLGIPGIAREKKSSPDEELTTENVEKQAAVYRILHAVPGRIRVLIPEVAKNADYAKRLERLAVADNRIINIRISSDTASVIVDYSANRVDQDEMESYLASLIQAASELGMEQFRPDKNGKTNGKLTDSQELVAVGSTKKLNQEKNAPVAEEQLPPKVDLPATELAENQELELPRSPKLETTKETEAKAIQQPNNQAEVVAETEAQTSQQPKTEKASCWSRFRNAMLAAMLNLMANLPVQKAEA